MSSIGLANNTRMGSQVIDTSPYEKIIEVVRFLLAYGWIIALVAGIGGSGAYLFASLQERVYESSANLIVLPFGSPTGGMEVEAIRSMNLNIMGTYVQILRSRELRNATFALLGDAYSEAELRAAEIRITPVANSSVITVSARSKNPDLAQDMTNAIARTTIENNPVPSLIERYPINLLDSANFPVDVASYSTLRLTLFGIIGGAVAGFIVAYVMAAFAQYRRSMQVSS